MLISLAVQHFRCISSAEVSFDSRATAIFGLNASGKTSLLEAIFFLSHGRSFRSAVRSELIAKGKEKLRVIGSLASPNRMPLVAGLEFDGVQAQLRLGGQAAASWQLAKALPVQVIDPSVHRILEEGSARRRRLIDWGVFHVKPHFLESWRRYQRALAQRNALLVQGAPESDLRIWTPPLVSAALAIDLDRAGYVALLNPHFERLGAELLEEPVHLRYRRGWPSDIEFEEALVASKARERRQRTTVVGPHRADVSIEVGGVVAKKRVSRGQQKLLAAALILAQIELRSATEISPVCLLLDDPAAELDVQNLGKLLQIIERTSAQVVLTSLVEPTFSQLPFGRAFHVEQGKFRQVI